MITHNSAWTMTEQALQASRAGPARTVETEALRGCPSSHGAAVSFQSYEGEGKRVDAVADTETLACNPVIAILVFCRSSTTLNGPIAVRSFSQPWEEVQRHSSPCASAISGQDSHPLGRNARCNDPSPQERRAEGRATGRPDSMATLD